MPTSWADKQRVIEIIGDVASDFGFGAPVLDHERSDWTEEDRTFGLGGSTPETQVVVSGGIEGPLGQWLWFTLQDLSKDTDGRFAEELAPSIEQGWEANTVTISYGANALLPEQLRDEFERRLEPFRGLTPPPPLET